MKPITIGDVTITSIVERDGPWRKPEIMFPTADKEVMWTHLRDMEPFVYDAEQDLLIITYRTHIVRTPQHTILIDTCTGEDKSYPAPWDFSKKPWLDGFTAEGLRFEDIDYVFCTHLHIDHCGWNTRLVDGRWVPTFPNAKYIFCKREYDYWAAETESGGNLPGGVWSMNCLPIVEAGQALLVEDDFALNDNIWLTPTPGHSPGHVCVNIRSVNHRAVFTGDMMHHALQCVEPDWSTCFCTDPAMAAQSRRRVLGEVADTDTLVLPVHFPGPSAGRVVSRGNAWRFRFVEE